MSLLNEELNNIKYLFGYKPGKVKFIKDMYGDFLFDRYYSEVNDNDYEDDED